MKYAGFFKSLNEISVSDFDEAVFEEYGVLHVLDGGLLSYEKNGKTVFSNIEALKKEWVDKQAELIINDFADRVAQRVVAILREQGVWVLDESRTECPLCGHETLDDFCPICGAKMKE